MSFEIQIDRYIFLRLDLEKKWRKAMNRIPRDQRKPMHERNLPLYTVLPCRAAGRHQVGWCFRMCKPVDGIGLCGRLAPHSIKGQAIQAMEQYYERQREKEALSSTSV